MIGWEEEERGLVRRNDGGIGGEGEENRIVGGG